MKGIKSALGVVFIITPSILCFEIPLPGGGRVKFESGGVVRIRMGDDKNNNNFPPIPPLGAVPDESTISSLQILDTGTVKGYGAFCTKPLEKHTFLGFYEGRRVESREELDKTCVSMDYVMSLDGGYTFLDGFERAQNRSVFSPAHLNHADKDNHACNCIRVLEEGRVAFFTSRDVVEGEELCFDYGNNYWKGKENYKI